MENLKKKNKKIKKLRKIYPKNYKSFKNRKPRVQSKGSTVMFITISAWCQSL